MLRRVIVERVVLTAALLALLAGQSTVLVGGRWWWLSATVLALTAIVVSVARLAVPRWTTAIAAAAAVLVTTWLVVPDAAWFAIPVPSRLSDQLSTGWNLIGSEEAPLEPPRSVILILAGSYALLLVALEAALSSTVRAALISIGFTTCFVIPPIICGITPSLWIFVVAAAAWLTLLWLDSAPAFSVRSGTVPVSIGVAALVAASFFPRLAPSVEASSLRLGRQITPAFGNGVNPIVALGENLRQGNDRVVLATRQSSATAPYLRVATLAEFTGKTWLPTRSWISDDSASAGAEGAKTQTKERITITARELDTSRVPVPYPTDRLSGLSQPVGIAPQDLTARLTSGGSVARQTWSADYREQRFTREELIDDSQGESDTTMVQYLQLPTRVPSVIETTARTRAGTGSDYEKIESLQDWLRSDFAYSTTAPVAEGYDGTGVEVIAKFLKAKSGYCVHFASTLAVMARTLGIPSRVVVGYAPAEDSTLVNGQRVYLTHANQLHAWTEVWLGKAGWVQFDATPGIGEPTDVASATTGGPIQTPAPEPAATATPTATAAPRQQRADRETAVNDTSASGASPVPLVVGAAVALLAATPWLVRLLRRRRRWRMGHDDVEPLWAEVIDTSADLGITFAPSRTPAEVAADIGQGSPAMTALLERVQASRYGPPGDVAARSGPDVVDEAERIVVELRSSVPWYRRVLAAALPRSLFGRRRVSSDRDR